MLSSKDGDDTGPGSMHANVVKPNYTDYLGSVSAHETREVSTLKAPRNHPPSRISPLLMAFATAGLCPRSPSQSRVRQLALVRAAIYATGATWGACKRQEPDNNGKPLAWLCAAPALNRI